MNEDLKTLTDNLILYLEETQPAIYLETPLVIEKPKAKKPPTQPIPVAPPVLRKKPKPAPPKPQAIKPKTVKPVEIKPTLELKPIKRDDDDPLTDIATSLQRSSPNLFIHTHVPSDHKARMRKSAWQVKSQLIDVPIFITRELRQFAPFLHNVAKAIDVNFAPSRLIEIDQFEQKNVWDTLLDDKIIKLILCPDLALWASPHLVTHYKQLPREKVHKLKNIDFILLPELSLYMKDPLLKRSLWTMLTQYYVRTLRNSDRRQAGDQTP